MTKGQLLKQLRQSEIIYKERVVLRNGETSDFYCDIKKAFGQPEILNALADEIGKLLPPSTSCVAVSGYGGLPLGSVVASRFNLKFTSVRSTSKDHGKSGMIDGYMPNKKDVVVIIDDVLTSGSSIRETFSTLSENNIKTDSAIVVVKRGSPELPISYSYIFTIEEVVGQ